MSKTKDSKIKENKEKLKKIVNECRILKGNSHGEMSEEMENLKIEIGVQILKQFMHNQRLKETAEKISSMEDISNVPKTLERVYLEDKDRIID